ncbi:hypothetical protein KDW82_08155, partial [Burkholderia vietnamiensis]|uniref:hypothetical protein n=1 Tax=Burkholderia vietnamiensis TaxID=60552 RepID=UPI001B9EB1BB
RGLALAEVSRGRDLRPDSVRPPRNKVQRIRLHPDKVQTYGSTEVREQGSWRWTDRVSMQGYGSVLRNDILPVPKGAPARKLPMAHTGRRP